MLARLAFAVGLPVIALASYLHATPARVQDEMIAQPANWVAFASDLRIQKAGQPENRGFFYRRSDGSTRSELGDGTQVVVSINNIRSGLHYKGVLSGTWVSQPLALPSHGYSPLQVRASTPGLTAYAEKIAGFEVYRHVTRNDAVSYRAPALNMFAIRAEMPGDAMTVIEHTNIRLLEPADALFEPPAGVTVKRLDTRGGLVFSESAAANP